MKKVLWQLFAVFATIIALSSAYLYVPQAFLSLDNRLRDFLFLARGPLPASKNVLIVDIDEKSLKTEGQWPWSRNKVAQLIDNLTEAEAGIIGLDIVFSEPDRTSPQHIASTLHLPDQALENYDATLANSIAESPTIGGYFFTFDEQNQTQTPLIPAVFIEKGGSAQQYIISPKALTLNIPIIQESFYSSGFFNNTPDTVGIIRRVPLLMRFQDVLYPSLDLEMIRIYTQTSRVIVENSITGVDNITLGELRIPTDRFARLIVNYRGPQRSFNYISASDILTKNFNKNDIAGKFILIGTSAIGLADLRATPFDSLMPGVEVHANVIDNIINQDFISLPNNTELWDLLIIILTVISVVLIMFFLNIWLILPFFLLSFYGFYLFFSHLLFVEGTVLNILFPLLALILSFIASLLIDYMISQHQKKIIMTVFAKKVSKNVMDDLIEHNSSALLAPRNREVTVFFSDIRSFTSISEQLAKPERVIAMLNTYMTPMVDNIVQLHGTVDKFIGDAIMAYWNAPITVEQHADKALQSALQQLTLLEVLNHQLLARYGIKIAIGIGIHTGEVTIGEMGSAGRSDYTIIGDNVNLGSRLEGLTKIYGVTIIISEETKKRLKESYRILSLDIVKVKGKEHAVEIFQVLQESEERSQEEINNYHHALSMYRDKQVSQALLRFKTLELSYSKKLYQLYISRCEEALAAGMENFDPVTKMFTK